MSVPVVVTNYRTSICSTLFGFTAGRNWRRNVTTGWFPDDSRTAPSRSRIGPRRGRQDGNWDVSSFCRAAPHLTRREGAAHGVQPQP